LLGLPRGQLFRSLSSWPALAQWVYHALCCAATRPRRRVVAQGGLRLYLVSSFGLAAFLVGLAGVLSAFISIVAAGLRADAVVRGQLATSLAALLAGFPVWLLAWWPAQAATRPTGPAGVAARRSWLRRLYLYGFALIAVIVTLVSAIAVVTSCSMPSCAWARAATLANMARRRVAASSPPCGFTLGVARWPPHRPRRRDRAARRRAGHRHCRRCRRWWHHRGRVMMATAAARLALCLRRDLPTLTLLPWAHARRRRRVAGRRAHRRPAGSGRTRRR
jgi:hypothetical protein